MPLETGGFINDLAPTNPLGSDPAGEGDDHLRLIKSCVRGTFQQMGTVFSQVRQQDTAVSISSTWNTNHFVVSASATTTVILTLPPASSITSGYYVDISTLTGANVSLVPSGAASINGGVSLAIPPFSSVHAYFVGGLSWRANVRPSGDGGAVFGGNVIVRGSMTVSGATVLAGGLSVSGVAVFSGAVAASGGLTVSGATQLGNTLSVSGATVLAGLTVQGTTTLSGTVVLSNGQLKFPATANPSADVNILDDYEEGTWTPTLTFATVGNLAVAYATRIGTYTKIGQLCYAKLGIATSTFTHTTSSGNMQVTGWPFAPAATGSFGVPSSAPVTSGMNIGAVYGMTGYLNSSSVMEFAALAQASPATVAALTAANHTTTVSLNMFLTVSYEVP